MSFAKLYRRTYVQQKNIKQKNKNKKHNNAATDYKW